MPRTNAAAVRGIYAGVDSTVDLSPAIESANVLVTALCEPLDYTNAQLEMIERWLAAHFHSLDNPRLAEEMIGRSRDLIQGKVDLGLKLTHHGQQALVFDYLGGLTPVASGNPKRVTMKWLGRTQRSVACEIQIQTESRSRVLASR